MLRASPDPIPCAPAFAIPERGEPPAGSALGGPGKEEAGGADSPLSQSWVHLNIPGRTNDPVQTPDRTRLAKLLEEREFHMDGTPKRGPRETMEEWEALIDLVKAILRAYYPLGVPYFLDRAGIPFRQVRAAVIKRDAWRAKREDLGELDCGCREPPHVLVDDPSRPLASLPLGYECCERCEQAVRELKIFAPLPIETCEACGLVLPTGWRSIGCEGCRPPPVVMTEVAREAEFPPPPTRVELAATAPGLQKRKVYCAVLPRVRARFDDEETAVRLADEVMKMDNSVIYELMESPRRLTEVLRTLHGRERDRRSQ